LTQPQIGLLDYAFGSSCKGEADVIDDVQDEASKHRLQERIDDAVTAALESQKKKGSESDDKVGEAMV
jgi:phytoene/squalene synthetase